MGWRTGEQGRSLRLAGRDQKQSPKWEMVAAMASQAALVPHALRACGTALSGTPSNSLPSSSSCSFPCSTRCVVPPRVTGKLWSFEARRVEALRAAGADVAAPASVEEEDGPNLPCGTCNSKGWLVCDFCKGQKTNVQVRANKFYRRCPSCRAVGVVICPQCKLFKCVSFPDGADGY